LAICASRADGSQVLDLQRDALLAAGVAPGHLYEDFASGNKRDDRPGLAACLKALRAGDTLLVWKLDRLGRNLHHLVTTVHDLAARGVGLRVLTGQGAQIDTTTAAGKLIFGIFAALDLCMELGVTRQTLYRHVAPDGSLRADGQRLLERKKS
jgi:DNA invertase Pin-like site-specific DNA recombinase